ADAGADVAPCCSARCWVAWGVAAVSAVAALEGVVLGAAAAASAAVAPRVAGNSDDGSAMTLLTLSEQQQVAEAIDHVERETDAGLVTVLAEEADDCRYIPLLWAGLIALVVPGAALFFTTALSAWQLDRKSTRLNSS